MQQGCQGADDDCVAGVSSTAHVRRDDLRVASANCFLQHAGLIAQHFRQGSKRRGHKARPGPFQAGYPDARPVESVTTMPRQ